MMASTKGNEGDANMPNPRKKVSPKVLARLAEQYKKEKEATDWSDWYSKSVGGAIYQELEKHAARDGVTLSVSGMYAMAEVFTYGDDLAYFIKHCSLDNYRELFIRIRDWQKPWFRQALIGAGKTLDKLYLINLTITEALGGVDRNAAGKFLPANMANEIGVGEERLEDISKAAAEAVEPMVQEHFTIRHYDAGDLWEHYRLVPRTDDVKLSCMNVTEPYISTMRKVLDSYNTILAAVKEKVADVRS